MLYSKKAKLYMHNEVKQTFKEKEDKRPKLSELTEVMCTSKLIDHLPKISRKMIFFMFDMSRSKNMSERGIGNLHKYERPRVCRK